MLELPAGLDWCDGLDSRPGTVSPSGTVKIQPFENYLQEEEGSPEIEQAESMTVRHRYIADYLTARQALYSLYRGLIRTDSDGNNYKVLSFGVTKISADRARLTVVEEGTGEPNNNGDILAQLPPD